MYSVSFVIAIVLVFCTIVCNAQMPTIQEIHPSVFSFGGGVRLTIYGSDFPVDSDSRNSLEVLIDGQICPLDLLSSSASRLLCVNVPPARVARELQFGAAQGGNQTVMVILRSGNIVSAPFGVQYTRSYTPFIDSLKRATRPGDSVEFTGVFSSADPDTLTAMVAMSTCDFRAIYGSGVSSIPLGGSMKCRLDKNAQAGIYNLSVNEESDLYRGAAIARGIHIREVYSIAEDGTPYNLRVFPVVRSVSPASLTANGGVIVTIRGVGFPGTLHHSIQVLIGASTQCKIVNVTQTEITCATTQSPFVASEYGGAGLSETVYQAAAGMTFPMSQAQVATAIASGTVLSTTNRLDDLLLRYEGASSPTAVLREGFFTAPHTAQYTFYCAASDSIKLLLDGKLSCVSEASEIGLEFVDQTQAISEVYNLTKGQVLSIRAEIGNGGTSQQRGVIYMSHSAPVGVKPQQVSVREEMLIFRPGMSLFTGIRAEGFTIIVNKTQMRVAGVGAGSFCNVTSVKETVLRTFPTMRITETVSENQEGCVYVVSFHDPIVFQSEGVQVTTVMQGGGSWWYPGIPAHLLTMKHSLSSGKFPVRLFVDGVPAGVEEGNSQSAIVSEETGTVTVTGVSPSTISSGQTVYFTGSNFALISALEARVYFSKPDQVCSNVTVQNDTSLSCVAGLFIAGTHKVFLSFGKYGSPAVSSDLYVRMYFKTLFVTPTTGYSSGMQLITIRGSGFPIGATSTFLNVSLGGAPCALVQVSSENIICRTSPMLENPTEAPAVNTSTATTFFIRVTLNQTHLPVSLTSDMWLAPDPSVLPPRYSYKYLDLPHVNTVSPSSGSGCDRRFVSLSGTVLTGDILFCDASKTACVACLAKASNVNGTEVNCTLGELAHGLYTVHVSTASGLGPSDTTYRSHFKVDSVTPQIGYKNGGTKLTIQGEGFSSGLVKVQLGVSGTCTIVSLNASTIVCSTPAVPNLGSTAITVASLTGNVIAKCPEATCNFTYAFDATTPAITSVMPLTGQLSLVTVAGRNFRPDIAAVSITVGAQKCHIRTMDSITETDSYVICELTEIGPAGRAAIVVTMDPYGVLPAVDPGHLFFDFGLSSTIAASPDHGSVAGGQLLTVTGSGFGASTQVTVASLPCLFGSGVKGAWYNATHIVCMTGSQSAFLSTSGPVVVTAGGRSVSCCIYRYVTLETPIVTLITPLSGSEGTTVELSGTGTLFNEVIDVRTMGISLLNVTLAQPFSIAMTQTGIVRAVIPRLPAFRATLDLKFPNGNAYVSRVQKFVSYPIVTNIVPKFVSQGGGLPITISGNRFADQEHLSVSVCGNPCAVLTSNYTQITCTAPPLVNVFSMSRMDVVGQAKRLSASPYVEAITPTASALSDGDIGTIMSAVKSVGSAVFVALDLGDESMAYVTTIRFFPAVGEEANMVNSLFQYSDDAVTWTTHTTVARVYPGWNEIYIIPGAVYGRFFRLLARGGIETFRVAEMVIEGMYGAPGGRDFCAVVVSMQIRGSDMMTTCLERPLLCVEVDSSIRLTFSAGLTGKVSRIDPAVGSIQGGTTVSLTGSFPSVTVGNITAVLGGVPCSVVSATTTTVKCITGPRGTSATTAVSSLMFDGYGASVFDVDGFRYGESWSSLLTWQSGEVPVAGGVVTIPAGVTIILDVSPPPLDALIIKGHLYTSSQLSSASTLVIETRYILIEGGSLNVGSPLTPFPGKFILRLVGNRDDPQVPGLGNKMIAVVGGALNMYGASKTIVTAKLLYSALAGSREITLAGLTGWSAGDSIVISASKYDHTEAEVRVIVSVVIIGMNTLIALDDALLYNHSAEIETRVGVSLDLSTDVGTLSRSVVIMNGGKSSEDPCYGGHVIITNGYSGEPSRFSINNVELDGLGKCGELHKHPITLVSQNSVSGNLVSGCSIHDSRNGAIVLDDSRLVSILSNTIYRTVGHGIALISGSAHDNIVSSNFILSTMRGAGRRVASIYSTNPSNTLQNNIVRGSEGNGFWFEFPRTTSRGTPNRCPVDMPLGVFSRNIAAGHAENGLLIFPRHLPRRTECGHTSIDQNPTTPTTITQFVSYFNGKAGIHVESVADYTFSDVSAVGNGEAGIFFGQSITGHFRVLSSKLFAHSLSTERDYVVHQTDTGISGVSAFNSEGLVVQKCFFVGYNSTEHASRAPHSAFRLCTGCGKTSTSELGGHVSYYSGILLISSPTIAILDGPQNDMMMDMDGSLTSIAGVNHTVLPKYGHIESLPGCDAVNRSISGDILGVTLLPMLICNSSYTFHRVVLFGEALNDTQSFVVTNKLYLTSQTWEYRKSAEREWQSGFVVIMPSGWFYRANDTRIWNTTELNMTITTTDSVDWEKIKVSVSESLPVYGSWLDICFKYTGTYVRLDTFDVYLQPNEKYPERPQISGIAALPTVVPTFFSPAQVVNLSSVNQEDKSHIFMDTTGKQLTIRYIPTVIAGRILRERLFEIRPLKCAATGCIFMKSPVGPVSYWWIDTRAWEDGTVPVDGQDVVIPPGMTVILTTTTAKLRSIVVQGTLLFHPRLDSELIANFVIVYGGSIQAGTELEPHTPTTKISLIHDKNMANLGVDEVFSLPSGTMLVVGHISLVGRRRETQWTSLSSFAEAGKSSLKTSRTIDWVKGDHVAITTGSYRMDGMEEVVFEDLASDNRGFTTQTPLRNEHVASSIDIDDENKLGMNSKVGLLSHNIIITGKTDGSGCWVVFKEYGFDTTFAARGLLENTEVNLCGFRNSSLGAVDVQDVNRFPLIIRHSAIHHSVSRGVKLSNTSSVTLDNNVIYISFGSSVQLLRSPNNVITNNLVFGTQFESFMTVRSNFSIPYALCSFESLSSVSKFSGNVAGGSESEGYCIQPAPCDDTVNAMGPNEAHGNVIGFFAAHYDDVAVLPSCVLITQVHAWHNSYIGIYSSLNVNAQLLRVRTHDNHIALFLGREGDSGNNTVTRSVIGGRAPAFDTKICSYFRCITNILDGSCVERAEVLGDGTRSFYEGEIGVLLGSAVMVSPRAHYSRDSASLPLFMTYRHAGSITAVNHFESTIFANFQFGRDFGKCAGSTMIATYGLSVLPVIPHLFRNTSFYKMVEESKIYLHLPSDNWRSNKMCDSHLCDSLNHVYVGDTDGTFVGTGIPTTIAAKYDEGSLLGCTEERNWNTYICPQISYGQLQVENLDIDHEDRNIEPLNIQNQDFLAEINGATQPPDCVSTVPGAPCTRHFKRPGVITTVLQTHNTYLVDFGTAAPMRTRWSFRHCSGSKDDSVILRIRFTALLDLSVWVTGFDDAPVSPQDTSLTFAGNAGDNYFELTDDRLYVLVPCDAQIEVHQLVAAKVGLKFNIPVEIFASQYLTGFTNRIASFLTVTESRLDVDSFYPGSTVVDFKIKGIDSAEYNSTTEATEVNSLVMAFVSANLTDLSKQVGLPVESLEYVVWAEDIPSGSIPDTVSIGLSDEIIATMVCLAFIVLVIIIVASRKSYKELLKYKDEDEQLAEENKRVLQEDEDQHQPIDELPLAGPISVDVGGTKAVRIKITDDI